MVLIEFTIAVLFFFFLMFLISAFLNVMLKTTKKKDWVISVALSLFLSIIYVASLGKYMFNNPLKNLILWI